MDKGKRYVGEINSVKTISPLSDTQERVGVLGAGFLGRRDLSQVEPLGVLSTKAAFRCGPRTKRLCEVSNNQG
jgi:hypothetical protein